MSNDSNQDTNHSNSRLFSTVPTKRHFLFLTYGIVLYILLTNWSWVGTQFGTILTLITPFIYGFVIAYILNGPYSYFRKLFLFAPTKEDSNLNYLGKALALVVTYLLFFTVIIGIFAIIIPEFINSFDMLLNSLPGYLDSLQKFSIQLLDQLHLTNDFWNQLQSIWTQLLKAMGSLISNIGPQILNITMNVTTSISQIIIGFMVSIYFLGGKDKFLAQINALFKAFVPKKYSDNIYHVAKLSNFTFRKFITGQLIEAFIIGILCFLGMSVLKMPYALLVSVIIGATNIIPIVGPILGAIPSAFIILMADPMQALWFIIFIIALQQLESNLIYPRVVGGSISLPGVWVLFAILVGGGLFGLAGMVLGVPAAAVLYALLREATHKRLDNQQPNS